MKAFFTQTEIACFRGVNLQAQWPIVMLFTHLGFLLLSVLCNLDLQLISQLGVGGKTCKCYRLTDRMIYWKRVFAECHLLCCFGRPHAKPKHWCQWQTCAQLFKKKKKKESQLNPSQVQFACLPVVSG